MHEKQANNREEGHEILSSPLTTLTPRCNLSNATTVDDASSDLAYRVRSRQGPVVMLVPASNGHDESAMLWI